MIGRKWGNRPTPSDNLDMPLTPPSAVALPEVRPVMAESPTPPDIHPTAVLRGDAPAGPAAVITGAASGIGQALFSPIDCPASCRFTPVSEANHGVYDARYAEPRRILPGIRLGA